jgi:hypothetical protein
MGYWEKLNQEQDKTPPWVWRLIGAFVIVGGSLVMAAVYGPWVLMIGRWWGLWD